MEHQAWRVGGSGEGTIHLWPRRRPKIQRNNVYIVPGRLGEEIGRTFSTTVEGKLWFLAMVRSICLPKRPNWPRGVPLSNRRFVRTLHIFRVHKITFGDHNWNIPTPPVILCCSVTSPHSKLLTGVVHEQNQRYNPGQHGVCGPNQEPGTEHVFNHFIL